MKKRHLTIIFIFLLFTACYPKSITNKSTFVNDGKDHKDKSRNYPNILLISIDTLRADHLGCYGYQGIKTPHIDQLAREGSLFTDCYTTVSVTLPSHATLMTGQYPPTHGVRDNGTFRLSEESLTLAEIFKARGYQTAAFVGSFVLDSRFGLAQGFDVYNDLMDSSKDKAEILFEEKRAEEVMKSAGDWLAGHKGAPFFMWIHCFDPHAPYSPPQAYLEGNQICAPGGQESFTSCYDGEIRYVDDMVGRFLQKMKEFGVYDNTLICFTADHGEAFGEHGEPSHGVFIYDSTLHIPLIIRCPQGILAGNVIQDQVNNADIAPTILRLAGDDRAHSTMQGRVVLSLDPAFPLSQEESPMYCESYYVFYNHRWSPLEGVRTKEWKYIKAPRPELYHLSEDPKEINNLYAQEKDQVTSMEKFLAELKNKYSKNTKSAMMPLDENTKSKLERLGYLKTAPAESYKENTGDYPDPKDMVITLNFFNVAAYHYLRHEYEQAISNFERSLEINPRDVFAHFMEGFIYYKMKNFEKARDQFLECIRLDPSYVNGYIHLGGAYFKLGQIDMALQQIEKSLDLDPDSIESYRNLAVLYIAGNDYDKAQKAYEEALTKDPNHAETLHGLSNLYFKKKDFSSALHCVQKALKHDTRFIDAYNTLGNIYFAQGKIDESKKVIEHALSLDTQRADTRTNLAEIYIQLNQYDLARQEITLAEKIDPEMVKVFNCRGSLAIKENNFQEALTQFQKAKQLEPKSSEIHYNLGLAYAGLQEMDLAIESFQESIQLDSQNNKSYFNLGLVFYRQHNLSQAIEAFQGALALEPDNIDILFYLGLAYQEQGDIDQAIALYQKILVKDDLHLNTRIKLSLAYFAKGQTDPGVSECKRILAIDPANEVAHINLGLTFFKQKEFDPAIKEYQQAIQTNPNNPVAYFQMAYCYFWQQNMEKGIECLKEALRINPDYQPAKQMLDQVQASQ